MERPRFNAREEGGRMKNAHLRFGWLTYVKCTEKTTTSIKLRLDRFIGEVLPDPPSQAKAHLISVIGGETQSAPLNGRSFFWDRLLCVAAGGQPNQAFLPRQA